MNERKKTIGFELRSLSMLVKRHIDSRCASVREMETLTGVHGWVIGYLYRNREREIYQRDLETRFEFKRSTATKLLQLLEKKGLITRVGVESDRRLKKITLTEKALEISERLEREFDAVDRELDSILTPSELATFFTLCDKIRTNLKDYTQHD